jgi:penicillin-binding protein 2
MVKNFFSSPPPAGTGTFGLDRVKLRLAVMIVLVVAVFVALYSRLWFLQVLASEDYRQLARENRIRVVHSEPERGAIFDRDHRVLVANRQSLAITVDRQIIDEPAEQRRVVRKLALLLVENRQNKRELRRTRRELRTGLSSDLVSPYKPVPVAYDVNRAAQTRIAENPEDWPGVGIELLTVREYPQGRIAAHVLGYVNEITKEQLKYDIFKGRRYGPGDIVGQNGVELTYDRYLRGKPGIRRVVVNSDHEVIGEVTNRDGQLGKNLVLSLDARIQRLTERALEAGIMAARSRYAAPDGAAVVLDPNTGEVVAAATSPSYDPSILADGLSFKEQDRLGAKTKNNPDDDALINRAIQGAVPPGSTFKVVTAGAAIANGVVSPFDTIDCNPSLVYRKEEFNNWTTADLGYMSLAKSLEVSCDTYYYELGARMEDRWGAAQGDGTERFQKYMRLAGFGHETGIDLPGEAPGRVPDAEWCEYINRETQDWDTPLCPRGWYPGYTVNMSIGQGDLIVSPIQMAVTFAAIANGGDVVVPRVALGVGVPHPENENEQILEREFQTKIADRLPLDDTTLSVMRQGLEAVVSSPAGTAYSAFSGFPLAQYPVAGKTGTAQIGSLESGKNFAWFISYAPADDPQYVVSVYIDRAGHGGESAAPVARQIYEGIFKIDQETTVRLGTDESG